MEEAVTFAAVDCIGGGLCVQQNRALQTAARFRARKRREAWTTDTTGKAVRARP